MKFSQSAIFKLALVVCLSLPLYTDAADVGTPCTSNGNECADNPGDPKKYLECSGGTDPKCQCNIAAQWETDKCVLKIGSTCQNPIVQPCLLFTECKQDANTPTEYKCQCKDGTTAVGAECKANYDAPCDATAGSTTNPNCAPATFSECLPAGAGQPSKCQCSTNEVWETPACALKAEETCDGSQPCRKLSTCPAAPAARKCTCDTNVADLIYNGFGACVIKNGAACDSNNNRPCDETTAICDATSKKCTCKTGVLENGYGHCRAIVGNSCDASKPCDLGAECNGTSNICQCKTGTVDDGEKRCRVIVNGTCNENFMEELICDKASTCQGGLCKCNDGTAPNLAQKCRVLAYGGTCDKINKLCDEGKHFECLTDNKCGCSGEFEYNEDSKVCSGASMILISTFTSVIALLMTSKSIFSR